MLWGVLFLFPTGFLAAHPGIPEWVAVPLPSQANKLDCFVFSQSHHDLPQFVVTSILDEFDVQGNILQCVICPFPSNTGHPTEILHDILKPPHKAKLPMGILFQVCNHGVYATIAVSGVTDIVCFCGAYLLQPKPVGRS